jgi:hypothetical protein
MEKQRTLGIACAIISEIFGIAYLLDGIIIGGFNTDMAVSTAQTMIQLTLVVFMLIGFFTVKKRLLFGAAMVSMVFNGFNYLLDDVAQTFPFDKLFVNNLWPDATYILIYFVVDIAWVVGIVLVFAATFGKRGHQLVKPGVILFFCCGSLLLVNLIFAGISLSMNNSDNPSGILSCFGDAFALYEYALAIGYCFDEEKATADQDLAEDEPDALLK